MEIARLLGWYRIPLRTAPKVVSVDYLAFYQPGSFGERGGQIEYVASVRGHELASRAELLKEEADHPRANEEYFKIQIGSLERLRKPIVAKKTIKKPTKNIVLLVFSLIAATSSFVQYFYYQHRNR